LPARPGNNGQQRGLEEQMTENKAKDRYLIEAVDRALQLLEVLAEGRDLGVTEIAKRMGVSKTLVFRMLHTLEQRGYVIRDPARRTNALGYRVLHLANAVEHHNSLVGTANPILDELAFACRENVNFLIRDGLGCLCVATRESSHQIRLFAQVGRHGPLHAGGGSKVLLAFAPLEVRQTVLRSNLQMFTQRTITDPIELEGVLDRIRADGYHEATNDLDDGAFSVAAPVYGSGSEVVAALSIAGPVTRYDERIAQHHRKLVLEHAAKLSIKLGGSVPGSPLALAS
jgi:DNA-binding IclR family transcriptional regulator